MYVYMYMYICINVCVCIYYIYIYIYIYIFDFDNFRVQIDMTTLNWKFFYHFAIFAIVNKILISEPNKLIKHIETAISHLTAYPRLLATLQKIISCYHCENYKMVENGFRFNLIHSTWSREIMRLLPICICIYVYVYMYICMYIIYTYIHKCIFVLNIYIYIYIKLYIY